MLKTRGIRTSTLSNRTKNGRIAKMKSNIFGRSLGDPKLYSKNSVLHDFQSILNPQNPRKCRFYKKIENPIFYVFWALAEVGGTGRQALFNKINIFGGFGVLKSIGNRVN